MYICTYIHIRRNDVVIEKMCTNILACVNVFICGYMYTCMCVHICTFVCLCVYIYIYKHTSQHVLML